MDARVAYPQLIPGTPTDLLPMNAVEGESVTLPCDIERSFLNQFTVTWSRQVNGTLMSLQGLDVDTFDYSLTLNDLKISESGVYQCIVEANDSLLTEDSQSSVTGRAIDLIVRSRHSKF